MSDEIKRLRRVSFTSKRPLKHTMYAIFLLSFKLSFDAPRRQDVYQLVSRLAQGLGASGLDFFATLLRLDPTERPSAEKALQLSFLSRRRCRSVSPEERRLRPRVEAEAQATQVSGSLTGSVTGSQVTPATLLAQCFEKGCQLTQESENCYCEPAMWSEMVKRDGKFVMLSPCEAEMHAEQVNRLVAMSVKLQEHEPEKSVGEQSLHLAVALVRDYRDADEFPELVELACLKLADALLEVSNEYYKRERLTTFAAASGWLADLILSTELDVFQQLQARMLRATAAWFLHSTMGVCDCDPQVMYVAEYINALLLYDIELLKHPAPLRALVSLLLSAFTHGLLKGEKALWSYIRVTTCWSHSREAVEAVFCRACHVVTTQRFLWATQGLNAIEMRYPTAARSLPSHFPKELVDELMPWLHVFQE